MVVSANLKQLPPEIVDMICDLLPVQDVAALEQVKCYIISLFFIENLENTLQPA